MPRSTPLPFDVPAAPLGPARCPGCACLPGHHHEWCPDRGPVLDSEKGHWCPYPLAGGDIVIVERGEYQGAFLDWVERDSFGWHVLRFSHRETTRTRKVLFYRRPQR